MLLHTDPISSSNLDDQLNGVFHEKPSISSHHQRGSLALGRLDDGDNALDEVLGIVLVLLEHRHPLPQPACPGLLVRVRFCLDRGYFHHVCQAPITFSRPVWSAEWPTRTRQQWQRRGIHEPVPATPSSNTRPLRLKGKERPCFSCSEIDYYIDNFLACQTNLPRDFSKYYKMQKLWHLAACHYQTFYSVYSPNVIRD